MYRKFFKRFIDVAASIIALALLWPVMLVIAIWIYLEDGGPVLFRQRRVGRGGETFSFLKFRSMPVDTGDVESAKAARLTVTGIGRVIRRTNLDELPQLINILKGDMSLVGPRPAIPKQENLCALRRANGAEKIAPGLTGLAQVSAYDRMPETEKAKWDGEYAARISFVNDVKIVGRTLGYLTKKPPVY